MKLLLIGIDLKIELCLVRCKSEQALLVTEGMDAHGIYDAEHNHFWV